MQIIVEHFEANLKHLLGGTAKAMVVTDSRKAAVRYKQAIDAYIAQHLLSEVAALVAFSGEVEVEAAVQTLSRLNRFVPDKTTMVLDFVNDGDDVRATFKPNFEDTDVEKLAILCSELARLLRLEGGKPDFDLNDVQLVHIRQKQAAQQTLDLIDGQAPAMGTGFTSAGSRAAHDPRLKLLDEIIAELNARFADEDFRADQERSWVEALLAAMKADPELREQAEVSSEAQFLASPSLRDAVTLAVVETNDTYSRMADLFHAKYDIEVSVIHLLGKLLYLDVHHAA